MNDRTNDELAYTRAVSAWRRRFGDGAAAYDPPVLAWIGATVVGAPR